MSLKGLGKGFRMFMAGQTGQANHESFARGTRGPVLAISHGLPGRAQAAAAAKAAEEASQSFWLKLPRTLLLLWCRLQNRKSDLLFVSVQGSGWQYEILLEVFKCVVRDDVRRRAYGIEFLWVAKKKGSTPKEQCFGRTAEVTSISMH